MSCNLAIWSVSASEIVREPIEHDVEEHACIARAAAGDSAAFGFLLTRYRTRAVRLASHILQRPDEAEDAAQEAFVRAYHSLKQFRGDARFYTWFCTILVRVCNGRRRLARWNTEVSFADMEIAAPAGESGVDNRLLVAGLMAKLSPPMRAALVLRELDGLEYQEVATVLHIPIGTVRSRLSAARAQFREMWLAAMQEYNNG